MEILDTISPLEIPRGGWGHAIWKNWKNIIWKFQGLTKTNVEFSGATKKIVESPSGLGHWCFALEIPMPMAECNVAFQIAKFVKLTFLLPLSRRQFCQKPKKIWRFQKDKTQFVLLCLTWNKKFIKIEPFSHRGNQYF